MLKSDLVSVLSAFTEAEQKRLIDFFNSPYGNLHHPAPHALHLVERIFQALKTKQAGGLDRDRLYAAIFPGEKPVANKLEKLATLALKITRLFIQNESFRKLSTPAFEHYLQGLFFEEKYMADAYEKTYEKNSAWKQKRTEWNHWDYCVNWLLEENRNTVKAKFYEKKDDQNLLYCLDALEDLYLYERHYNTVRLLNINNVTLLLSEAQKHDLLKLLKYPYKPSFHDSQNGLLFEQAIAILQNTVETGVQSLDDFQQGIVQMESTLSPFLLSHFEVFAINYCVQNLTKNKAYLSILFQFLKQRVETGRCFYDGKITAGEFQNIVKAGLTHREFDWVYQFLEKNRFNITGNHPEELYRFNLATYWFYTKDFDKALDILLTSDYQELQYKMSAKILEIKILYETESEVLPARIDAAKIFFYRESRLPKAKIEQYLRFADFMRRLLRPQTAVSPERILKLKKELSDNPAIVELYWLLEKLDLLLRNS